MAENPENQLTVLEDEKDKLMHHEFDGIHELDNDLPSWWVWLFILCILNAIAYIGYYHVYQDGNTMQNEYQAEIAQAEAAYKLRLENLDKLPANERQEFLASLGANVFQSNCVLCHGDKGQGSVGPNLTDNFALHAYDDQSLDRVIREGVISRGMPAWEKTLNKVDRQAVTAYVATLTNTNVKGKAPQGHDLSKGVEAFKKAADASKIAVTEVKKELSAADKETFIATKGPELYASKCLACHGDKGQGIIGPNLTDNFIKNGTTKADMQKVIENGIPATAMVAWKAQLSELEIETLTEYIWSLKGKNIPGKAPEGKEVK